MEMTRLLGAHRLTWVMDLGAFERGACSWHLLRREEDGTRFLLQRWSPRPPEKELDQLREAFLSRYLDASVHDSTEAHFGFDEDQAWLIQAVQGQPLLRTWTEASPAQRKSLWRQVRAAVAASRHPRLLHPEVLGVRAGAIILPRVLGSSAPWDMDHFRTLLPEEPTADGTALPAALWEQPRDLSLPLASPIRGRGQELTYLKSLMLGLGAPVVIERIVLLQGEEGVGKESLATWACAVAESEGMWVHSFGLSHDDTPARVLQQVLEALLRGLEADLYSQEPDVARGLSRLLPAYHFLTGGRHHNRGAAHPEPSEVEAALKAMDFARTAHPQMVHLARLDRAAPEVLTLAEELIRRSSLPWLLSLTSGAHQGAVRQFTGKIKVDPSAAVVHLNRLEDKDLRQVLDDILGPHHMPEGVVTDFMRASLGNSGLVRSFLELAQQEGSLAWSDGAWRLAPGRRPTLQPSGDLVQQVFLGRLQKLTPAGTALVRLLAIAERPIPVAALGRALGLGGDPLEEAIQAAVESKLAQLQGGEAAIPDPNWQAQVLQNTTVAEQKRLARALLGAMQEAEASPVLSVTLQALASDEGTALASVLKAIEHDPIVPPQEAQRIVDQALQLRPSPAERSRLFEFLADAWLHGFRSPAPSAPASAFQPQAREALQKALEAAAELPEGNDARAVMEARLHRKRALLALRSRKLPEAKEAIQTAGQHLADHPLHPEQARLRLALGKLHLAQGFLTKGVRALEEGLSLAQGGAKGTVHDQALLLLELGRALGAQSQLQRATALLQHAQRLLEHEQDFRGLVPIQLALAQLRLAQGDGPGTESLLQEALRTASLQGDLMLQAQAHLALGTTYSFQQKLDLSMGHLDQALDCFHQLGDAAQARLAQTWRARTLASLGDNVAAEHLLLQSLGGTVLAPGEEGDQIALQAEIAYLQGAWRDAARLYGAAAGRYEAAGFTWRTWLIQLRLIQSEAREAMRAQKPAQERTWTFLESLKGPVEGSGSRWLELQWHRAHALLLGTAEPTEPVILEALQAWSEAIGLARDLGFQGQVLEGCAEGAFLLVQRGERLGARSRIQDSFAAFQGLWSHVPERYEKLFLGRVDLHRYQEAVTAAGLRFVLPERISPERTTPAPESR